MKQNKNRNDASDETIRNLEALCWELKLQGRGLDEIARELDQTPDWVAAFLDRTLKGKDDLPLYSPRAYIEKLIDELDLVRKNAWQAWEKSGEDRVKFTDKVTTGGTGGDKTDKTTYQESQSGDASFLRAITDCNKREGSLRGVERAGQALLTAADNGDAEIDRIAALLGVTRHGERDLLRELGRLDGGRQT